MKSTYSKLDEQSTTEESNQPKLPVLSGKNRDGDNVPLLASTWAEVDSESESELDTPKSINLDEHIDDFVENEVQIEKEDSEDREVSEDEPVNHTNPFADDYIPPLTSKLDEVSLGEAAAISTESDSPRHQTNPFADDYDESVATSPRDQTSYVSVCKSGSTNPFADDYDPQAIQKNLPSRRASNPSVPTASSTRDKVPARGMEKRRSAPLIFAEAPTQAQQSNGAKPTLGLRAQSERVIRAPVVPSPLALSEDSPLFRGTVLLMSLGFTPACSYRTMLKEEDYPRAVSRLRRSVKADCSVKVGGSKLWNPPLVVRIGSWMPSTGNKQHIEYFVTVKPHGSDASYVVMKRYSQFYELKAILRRFQHETGEDFEEGFVDDRVGTFLWGVTEETYYTRQVMLDKWLRRLSLCGMAMSHPSINVAVFDFLCVKDFVYRKAIVTPNREEPIQIITTIRDASEAR